MKRFFIHGRIGAALMLAFCSLTIAGQTADKLAQAEAVYAEAVKLIEQQTIEAGQASLPKFVEARRLFEAAGNAERKKEATAYLAVVARKLGRYFLENEYFARAAEYFEQSLPYYVEIGDRAGEAMALHDAGYVAARQNEPEREKVFYERALAAYRETKNADGAAIILRNLGIVAANAKDYARAAKFYEEALAIRRERKERAEEAGLLKDLGAAFENLENYERAAFYFAQALPINRELKNAAAEAATLHSLGYAAYKQNKSVDAVGFYEQAAVAYRAASDANGEALVERNAGLIYYERKNYAAATRHFEKSLALRRQLADRSSEAVLLADLGDVFYAGNNFEKSAVFYGQALEIYRALPDRAGELDAAGKLAASYNESFRAAQAVPLYEQMLAAYAADKNARLKAAQTRQQLARSYLLLRNHTIAETFAAQAAAEFRELKDETSEAYALLLLGGIYGARHADEQALTTYRQATAIFRRVKDRAGEGYTLVSLADVYSYRNRHDEAVAAVKQAQAIFRDLKDAYGEFAIHNSLGWLRYTLSEYEESFKHYERALKIAEQLKDIARQTQILTNTAVAHSALGQYERAIRLYERVLVLARKNGDRYTEGIVLGNIGYDAFKQNDYEKAKHYIESSNKILNEIKARREEAYGLHNLGLVFYKLKNYERALALYDQTLPIYLEVGDRRPEAFLYDSYGEVYTDLGHFDKAAENLEKSLILAREIKYSNVEGNALTNLMILWERRRQPRLAVFYGKQAVNVFQAIRGGNRNLDKEAQKSFLKSNEETYRRLADLLIAEGRLIEAQQILDMLKEEEFSEFVRRDASEVERLAQRADLTTDESAALRRYQSSSARVAEIGFEFGKLQDAKNNLPEGAQLSAADQKRFDELARQLEDAAAAFQVFLRGLSEEFAKKPKIVEEIQENTGLQADLKSWGVGIVALYTVVGTDRYRVILTTPDAQIDGKTEISAEDLNRKISEFRQAVQNPNADPRPLGKELYDILIKPIEKQLADARAKTLLWSLDGTLRYLPLAALWDGERYFGQKYENVVITLASRTRLGETVSPDWRVLGLGVTDAKAVLEPTGTEKISFGALPAVRDELRAIVSDETTRGENGGVLPGVILLNENFTETAFKERLAKGFEVVHIASHFSFRPGNETKSFLLLGDGSALPLAKVRTSPQLKFKGVELLTLSACQTAVGETDATGKEIESFGEIAQQNGAKAVLATLWSVADESTGALMSEFYRLRKENARLTKAEAMRLAQKSMIEGKLKPSTEDGKRRAELAGGGQPANGKKFVADKTKPFAHPFYWSPFVLIGNWR